MSGTAAERSWHWSKPPRLEDARFLEGRGQFCADIALPGMLHAAFVRSPHAHARIMAVKKPGVLKQQVYAAADLTVSAGSGPPPSFRASSRPIGPSLPPDKVRHAGEPIAMAIGASPAEAEDIAGLVEVEFEPLPPVVSMWDALKKRRHSCTTTGATTSSSI